jgi:hypothetical protein
MNDFQAKRSMPLIFTILGTLALSVILLYALPTLTAGDGCDPDWDDCSSLNFSDATAYIEIFSNSGWIIDLARIGALGIIVATLAFSIDQRGNQKVAILAGATAMLIMPIWILKHRDGGGIGLGIILYCIGVIAVAIIPFVFTSSAPSPSSSATYWGDLGEKSK